LFKTLFLAMYMLGSNISHCIYGLKTIYFTYKNSIVKDNICNFKNSFD
jgi:hypothetical protein